MTWEGYAVSAIGGGILCGYLIYLHMKFKELDLIVRSFPTPREMAEEVMRMKIPYGELPPDLQEGFKKHMADTGLKNKGSSYIG